MQVIIWLNHSPLPGYAAMPLMYMDQIPTYLPTDCLRINDLSIVELRYYRRERRHVDSGNELTPSGTYSALWQEFYINQWSVVQLIKKGSTWGTYSVWPFLTPEPPRKI